MNTRVSEGYRALTEKEKETLRLIVRGHDAKSIARSLDLSVHTINERLRDARRKMAVSSSRQAARLLLETEGAGLGSPNPDLLGDTEIGEDVTPRPVDQGTAPTSGAGRAHRHSWIMMGVLLMTLALGLLALTALPQLASPLPLAPTTSRTTPDSEVRDAAISTTADAPQSTANQFVFVGNRHFSSAQLARELARSDYGVPLADAELQLRRFYFTQGYADFSIVSATTDPSKGAQDSITTFVVNEGERYKFGEISVRSALPEFDGPTFARTLPEKEGDWYDARMTRGTMDWLNEGVLRRRAATATVAFRRDPSARIMSVTFIIANRAPVATAPKMPTASADAGRSPPTNPQKPSSDK